MLKAWFKNRKKSKFPYLLSISVLAILMASASITAVSYHYSSSAPELAAAPTSSAPTALSAKPDDIFTQEVAELEQKQLEERMRKAKERQAKIDRVEAFFTRYGAKLSGYGHIMVDQAEKCGGDYRVLVGIAGSESGLGRAMYKKYNPYGYLNGVQYSNLTEALTYLSCKVSAQHIAPCGQDLYCLAKRYAGPQDDLDHFVSKVRWFMNQV